MANQQNLKPARKGEIRNPNGKPPGTRNRSTIVKEILSVLRQVPDPLKAVYAELPEKISLEEIITYAQAERASNGDTNAYKALMDSAYGAPKQETALTDPNGEALGFYALLKESSIKPDSSQP